MGICFRYLDYYLIDLINLYQGENRRKANPVICLSVFHSPIYYFTNGGLQRQDNNKRMLTLNGLKPKRLTLILLNPEDYASSDSTKKNIGYSSRRPSFSSQYPCGDTKQSVTLTPGHLTPSGFYKH